MTAESDWNEPGYVPLRGPVPVSTPDLSMTGPLFPWKAEDEDSELMKLMRLLIAELRLLRDALEKPRD